MVVTIIIGDDFVRELERGWKTHHYMSKAKFKISDLVMKRFKVVIYFWNIWVQRWLFILSHSNISGPHHKESLHSREVKVGVRQWEDSRKQRWFRNLKSVGYSWLKISDVADVPTELTTAPSNQISDFLFFFFFTFTLFEQRSKFVWIVHGCWPR